MEKLLGSRIKVKVLASLGLRGGASGRSLAQRIKASPTPVYKALRQLVKAGVIVHYGQHGPQCYYALNTLYLYYPEILSMIQKWAKHHPKETKTLLPNIPKARQINPEAIYEMAALRGPSQKVAKLSDVLRQKYA